jgi:hypothetical protein
MPVGVAESIDDGIARARDAIAIGDARAKVEQFHRHHATHRRVTSRHISRLTPPTAIRTLPR